MSGFRKCSQKPFKKCFLGKTKHYYNFLLELKEFFFGWKKSIFPILIQNSPNIEEGFWCKSNRHATLKKVKFLNNPKNTNFTNPTSIFA